MNSSYIKSLLGMIFLAGYIDSSYSQATSGFSTAPGANQPAGAGDYVGWTSGTNLSLEINNQDAYPINFSTINSPRMTILGSGNTGYVGIATASPSSILHIDGNGTPSTTGEVFRTDAPSTATYWRMFRAGSEYGRIWNNADANFYIQAVNSSGDLRFQSGGSVTRMTLTNTGDVGIGTNFTSPSGRLHQFVSGTNNNFHYFETGITGAFKKFRIGMTSTNTVELNIDQNWPINFLTSSTQRMTILGTGEVGINNASPSSKLEITSGSAGVSGLEFSDLTSLYNPGATATKFLTVASDGKVILRDESGVGSVTSAANGTSLSSNVVQLGQNVSGSGGQLTSDREIPLDNNNIFFTEPVSPNATDNGIGIGIGTTIDPTVRLDVAKSTLSSPALNTVVAGRFAANATFDDPNNDCIGVIGKAEGVTSATEVYNMIGGKFTATGTAYNFTIGVDGYGEGYQTSVYGGKFEAVGTDVNGGGSTGVYGTASGSQDNYAIYGFVASPSPNNWAGYFSGDVTYTGTLVPPSDSSIKSNINQLNNLSPLLNQLTPHSYTFNHAVYPQLTLPNGINYGLISQEVESVFPELVKQINIPPQKDANGVVIHSGGTVKGLNYTGLIPLLLQGWKEQQQLITDLQNQLNQLQSVVDNCCNAGNRESNPDNGEDGNSSSIDIELKNAKSIILNQNVPNPFAEQTTISYFIPDDVKQAQIFFYDNKGIILKTVDINEKGSGQINVFAGDLSSGNYTYTLIADGKVIETKKMIKQ